MVNSRFFRNLATVSTLVPIAICASVRAGSSQVIDWRAYGGYFQQNSWAGTAGFTSATWLMVQPEFGNARMRAGGHVMLSADPLLNGECGQPRFLPEASPCGITTSMSHPLVMMLGVHAAIQLADIELGLHASAVGEPAFGPHAYFMRASAQHDPAAPLTHHFFNPAHSAHGVITASLAHRGWQFEASLFNARAVNDLYEIRMASLNAQAMRVSFTTSSALRLQASAARFPDVGGHHGHSGEMQAYSLTADGALQNNLFYTAGCAAHHVADETPKACFAEATFAKGIHLFYGRAEAADRLEQETIMAPNPVDEHDHILVNKMLPASEFAVGYGLRLPAFRGLQTSLGVRAAIMPLSSYLRVRYLEERAVSMMVFFSARPSGSGHHH